MFNDFLPLLNSVPPVPGASSRTGSSRAETRWCAGGPGCWPGGVGDIGERRLPAVDRGING